VWRCVRHELLTRGNAEVHSLELGTETSTSAAPFHWLNLPTFSDSLQNDLLVLLRMRLPDDDKQVAS
jgi:hypothetical protein